MIIAITSIIAIVLTTINVILTYYNFQYTRKKDFQDKLFQFKYDAYKELNEACYEMTKRLDINSTPFVQLYEIEDKKEWEDYFKKKITPLHNEVFDIQKLAYKYALILPPTIVNQYEEFTNNCLQYVTHSFHHDAEMLIDDQERLEALYDDLRDSFRDDLKIEKIEGGLRKRITS